MKQYVIYVYKNVFVRYLKSHLDVNSLDDTGDDMKHLHFGVALCHLLQQLEEQPEYRLKVLNREWRIKELERGGNEELKMLIYSLIIETFNFTCHRIKS